MKRHITVLGAGRMGSALALAFLEHGHAVTVWNRTSAKAAPLVASGARAASSVADAVTGADIVVGNINDYATCAALLAPPAVTGALRGKLLVQLTTGTPRQAKDMAAWAHAHQIDYLDGAIMATPNVIGEPGCTIVYAGPQALFAANQAVFAALGGNALHVGADVGHASALDAALLILVWGAVLGVAQGAAICEAEGFALDAFADSIGATLPVIEGMLKDVVGRVAARRFAADDATLSTLDTCHASVRLIHEISKEHGLHLGLTDVLDRIFQRASDAGYATGDLAAVYQVVADRPV